jgi:type VI secretion system secreted protein VgrG
MKENLEQNMATSYVAFLSVDGKSVAGASQFSGRETISDIPEYQIILPDVEGTLTSYLGKSAKIVFPERDSGVRSRTYEGIITDAELTKDTGNAFSERQVATFVIKPFLVLLGYSSASCIYQNKSSVDIFKDVLERNGLQRAKLKVSATPPKRDTCIQYNENDLAFVQRILAEDGIVFYFHDGSDGSTMVIHDTAKPYPANTSGAVEMTDPSAPDANLFQAHGLSLGRQVVAGKVSLTSYDVDKAAQAVGGPLTSADTHMTGKPNITEYRAAWGATVQSAAPTFARQIKGAETRLTGNTDHPELYLGQSMKLAKVSDVAMKGSYVISGIEFSTQAGLIKTRFRAAPIADPYLPPYVPKPTIAGVHNALVVGGDDGTPVCDAEGRVKVKFFWDMSAAKTDTTGWIRVAEAYAGKGYGGQFTPRVGHEVLVSFLHGDPDCPVITGQIYNAKNKPPFAKANTTKSGFSTKLKGKANELIFDDADGKEMLTLNAAKDYTLTVEDAVTQTVKGDEKTIIKGAATRKVEKTYDVDVTQAMTLDAETITVTGKSKIIFKVGGSSIELSSSSIEIKTQSLSLDSTQLTAKGSAKFQISGGQGTVQATGPLNLKGMQLNAEGSVTATLKGTAMASVEASGMTQIKGALVKVN